MTDPRGLLSVELTTEEDRADLGSLAGGVHVYEVGSYEGCACGFQLGEHAVAWSEEDRVRNRASIDALVTYLTERAAEGHELRLAAGWWGTTEFSRRRTLTPTDFAAPDFAFDDDGELVTFRAE